MPLCACTLCAPSPRPPLDHHPPAPPARLPPLPPSFPHPPTHLPTYLPTYVPNYLLNHLQVAGLSLGDRVGCPFTSSCGSCYYCERGATCRCDHREAHLLGWISEPEAELPAAQRRGLHGSQAQYVRVPLASSTLVKVGRCCGLIIKLQPLDHTITMFFLLAVIVTSRPCCTTVCDVSSSSPVVGSAATGWHIRLPLAQMAQVGWQAAATLCSPPLLSPSPPSAPHCC